jgi:hypothetical protein
MAVLYRTYEHNINFSLSGEKHEYFSSFLYYSDADLRRHLVSTCVSVLF